MKNLLFLKVDKRGKYLQLIIDLKKGKFDTNNFLTDAEKFRTFGFQKEIKADMFMYSDYEYSRGKARLSAFENLIETILTEAENLDLGCLACVLIDIFMDEEGPTYWILKARYQFLIHC